MGESFETLLSAVQGGDVWLFALLFLGVFFAVLGVFFLRAPETALESRLKRGGRGGLVEIDPTALRPDGQDRWLEPLAPYLEPKRAGELEEAQRAMLQAGFRSRFALRLFYLARMALALAALFAGAGLAALWVAPGQEHVALIFGLGVGAIGYALPGAYISARRAARRDAIRDAFPDALDMLLVCVEAGQGTDQSISRVAIEIEAAHPELAGEFAYLSAQLRAGLDKREAFEGLANRTAVDEIAAFASALIQSQESGASIGRALRVYADEMRAKRMLRAEAKANLVPMKLALGTMAFTLPPLLIVVMGPTFVLFSDSVKLLGGAG